METDHQDHAKCTTQFVQIAASKHKFHSSQLKEDLYIAGIASLSTEINKVEFQRVVRDKIDEKLFPKFFLFILSIAIVTHEFLIYGIGNTKNNR